ncbi:MAG: hypothetical protein HYU87_07835 [Chloroflexi bacterium]|nr:hypothetical protein [Chloroflexota bacterium]
MTLSRRTLLVALGSAFAGAGAAYTVRELQLGPQERETEALRRKVTALSYNVASGGGINRKLMPDPLTGRATVPLDEAFTFNRDHAMCRVDTNPAAFRMPTYAMGEVVIAPNQFYMAMATTTIEQFRVFTAADGRRHAILKGGLSCATEVGQASTKLGSRTAAEHATYEIEAVDGGIGGGKAGDSFAFTVFFDQKEAPLNHAIFGPKFTFTGEMTEGEITIVDPGA